MQSDVEILAATDNQEVNINALYFYRQRKKSLLVASVQTILQGGCAPYEKTGNVLLLQKATRFVMWNKRPFQSIGKLK